jgi:hypothetical protein
VEKAETMTSQTGEARVSNRHELTPDPCPIRSACVDHGASVSLHNHCRTDAVRFMR